MAKEELQSINEELQTVNSELKVKLEAISRAHSDLQNLMAATDIGTLFLDASLRVKRFTERVTDLFSVTPADEGRPITDFTHQLEYEDLIKDARGVLAELTPVRREFRSRKGQWYDMRIRPYRTLDNKIDGVMITFVNITERLQVEEALRQSERRLRQQKILVDLARDPILVWDFDGEILEWNRGCEVLYGFSAGEAVGKKIDKLLDTTVPHSSVEAMRAALLAERTWSGQLIQRAKDGRSIPAESRLHLEEIDGRRVVLETARDMGDRKRWEDRQEMLLNEIKHRVKNILAVVQAVAGQTAKETGAGKEFLTTFRGRVAALASAQDLLTQSEWHGADLKELVQAELKPYESKRAERVSVSGEPVMLAPGIATPLGLVIHELGVNAAKYGALSVMEGDVAVSWTVDNTGGKRLLTLVWRERNGPKVGKAAPKGGGGALIDRALPDANITRELDPEGAVCTIRLPLATGVERP